jgi:hypothetical protein
MDNQELIHVIKEWLTIDESISELRQEVRKHTTRKKDLTDKLVHIMKEKKLDEIDLADGKIVRKSKTVMSSVSKKHLLGCLEQYYKDPETAKEVSEFILKTRKEKKCDTIIKR